IARTRASCIVLIHNTTPAKANITVARTTRTPQRSMSHPQGKQKRLPNRVATRLIWAKPEALSSGKSASSRVVISPSPCVRAGSVAHIASEADTITAAVRFTGGVTGSVMSAMAGAASALSEIDARSSVFGILLYQPLVELPVVSVALVTTIPARVVAEIELPAPPVARVWRRTVRRKPAKDRHIA